MANYRCLQHDCWDDDNLVPLGETIFGNPVRIDRQYMEADVKILTGFIEPHFFAGFSGGPKAVLPSIAGIESVMSNHGAGMVGAAEARWGVTRGNPIWEEMLDVAKKTEPTFLLNVTINRRREITGIFAGDLEAAHARGCEFCRQSAMVPVPHAYDIVITSNSGYPLDLNLYQAVKGMSAASEAVRPGGAIIVAAQCWDGLPDHGEYARLLRSAEQPARSAGADPAARFPRPRSVAGAGPGPDPGQGRCLCLQRRTERRADPRGVAPAERRHRGYAGRVN